MSEDTLVGYVRGGMRGRWSMTKHHDAFTPGIPDISYRSQGVNGWLELKECTALPARPLTPLKFGSEFTLEQALFLRDRDGKLLIRVTPERLYIGLNAPQAWALHADRGWPLLRFVNEGRVWKHRIDWRQFEQWLSTSGT